MPVYEPNLSARQVHDCFAHTLHEAESVRRNLVLWFAELYRRKLYLELGYTSIFAYTAERHGFSKSRCAQFIRLAESLKKLPALHDSLAAGELPWTKAREVAKVATPETERAWVNEAKRSSRRALEQKIAVARGKARESRGPARDQGRLALGAAERSEPAGGSEGGDEQAAAVFREIPEEVRLRFPALQYAEYGVLVEKLRKLGWKAPVEDLVVAGLAALAGVGRAPVGGAKRSAASGPNPRAAAAGVDTVGTAAPAETYVTAGGPGARPPHGARSSAGPTNGHRPAANPILGDRSARCTRVPASAPYQVVIRHCESCGNGEVMTGRGPKPLHPAELAAVLCDARIHRRGEKNRAAIPPALHREVLERDGHRCRVAGCESGRFLSVHHRKPRSAGGTNAPGNLVTLCASCHRTIHEMAGPAGREALQSVPGKLPTTAGSSTRVHRRPATGERGPR